jgi:hypothetical protein
MPLWSGKKMPCWISVTLPLASISTLVMPIEAQTSPSPGIVTWPSCPWVRMVTESSGWSISANPPTPRVVTVPGHGEPFETGRDR